jgi:hypothetical protein
VFARRPWKNPKFLVSSRATGQYGGAHFTQIVAPRAPRRLDLLVPLAVAATPGWLAYWAVRLPMRLINPNAPIHQALDNSPHRWPVAA